MFKIINKKYIAENIISFQVDAPRIAKEVKPGQFVIVKLFDDDIRVPLAICDYDIHRRTISVVVKLWDQAGKKLAQLEPGDNFKELIGPVGRPLEFANADIKQLKDKRIIFVSGELGTISIYPQIKWLHERGVYTDAILGCSSKERLLLESEIRSVTRNLYISTDNDQYCYSGTATDLLKDLIEKERKQYDIVVPVGPNIMMKFIAKLTRNYDVKTIMNANLICHPV